jgi:hypothetical protein
MGAECHNNPYVAARPYATFGSTCVKMRKLAMFDRHDSGFFFRYSARLQRRFRKTWIWAAPLVGGAFVLADPRGISLKGILVAASIVCGVWILAFVFERINDALADLHSDPD